MPEPPDGFLIRVKHHHFLGHYRCHLRAGITYQQLVQRQHALEILVPVHHE